MRWQTLKNLKISVWVKQGNIWTFLVGEYIGIITLDSHCEGFMRLCMSSSYDKYTILCLGFVPIDTERFLKFQRLKIKDNKLWKVKDIIYRLKIIQSILFLAMRLFVFKMSKVMNNTIFQGVVILGEWGGRDMPQRRDMQNLVLFGK